MRVIVPSPEKPEIMAYAMARYSRSASPFEESLEWVKKQSEDKASDFMNTYYFDYGHASIADLGHIAVCFEGISELAAIEILDEPLWDGQQRSTRYQNFSDSEPAFGVGVDEYDYDNYMREYRRLMDAYGSVYQAAFKSFDGQYPADDASAIRTMKARAFDSARYLLPLCIQTNIGQVTSLRTLERQLKRMLRSKLGEVNDIARQTIEAMRGQAPAFSKRLDMESERIAQGISSEDFGLRLYRALDIKEFRSPSSYNPVACHHLNDFADPIFAHCAAAIYPYCESVSFSQILRAMIAIGPQKLKYFIDECLDRRSQLPNCFRLSPYIFEITCDIGAYRDLHRHRRCTQFRKANWMVGKVPSFSCPEFYTPEYDSAILKSGVFYKAYKDPYMLPMGTDIRFLMSMDLAEAQYIIHQRSSVKGHPSYRRVAYDMYRELIRADPWTSEILQVTHPDVKDDLNR